LTEQKNTGMKLLSALLEKCNGCQNFSLN